MKLTFKQFYYVLQNTDMKMLPSVLRYIFSFEDNIGIMAAYIYPDAIKARSPKFHEYIYKFLLNDDNGAIAAPRGFAKSTVVGLFYLTWVIVNKRKKYIVYMSQNHDKTVQFIEPLRSAFKTNVRLRFIYGDLTPKAIEDDNIDSIDRQDLIDIGGVRIQAVSFNKNIRGFKCGNDRPDLIIGDDIDDDERVINPELRLKDLFKLTKQIIPSLANNNTACFKMIGTVIHLDSLLMNRIKHYNGQIYKACELDSSGKIIESSLLWAEFWTVERLLKTKHDIGSISFNSEYLNNPLESDASIIKREWINSCLNTNLSYQEAKQMQYEDKYDGCDFAFGDRITNDKSAYVSLGVQREGPHVLFDITTYKGLSITEQFDILESRHKLYNFTETVMEENSIRGMSKELNKYTINYYLIWTGSSDPAEQLKTQQEFNDKRHTVSKKNMIIRLATQLENKNVMLPYKTNEDKIKTNILIDELLTFALNDGKLVEIGVHADIPIALAMGLERIGNSKKSCLSWA